ncbi:YkvA family protein [Saccharopolyspora griseoalba]|uniref:YkvA family protein n=1 Tax=Saccharopolyspora griseoalba TaxID=1431848 RepID=A0ABW2LCT3_9PSEU
MIVLGGLLVLAGIVVAVVFGGDAGGWLLPVGMITAGLGMAVAGLVARIRRRIPLLAAVRAHRASPVRSPVARLRALPGMLRATARGRNPALPRYQLALWAAALVYLVSPIDFIPDLVPLLGIGDDIGVGTWLLTSLYAESGNYVAVREQQPEPGARGSA